MSKKTIVFKMPATDSPRRDGETSDPAAPVDESSPAVFAREADGTDISNAAAPDQWVRRRNVNGAPTAPAPSSQGFAAKRGPAIDLAAERDFGEVVALSLMVPPMLGWYWFANTMDRCRRIFAG